MKVFVYGTLMRRKSNSHFLDRAKYLGQAVTDNRFEMVDVGYPMMLPSDSPDAAPVKGELYDIGDDAETLAALDRLEGVAHGLYQRVTGMVICKGMRRRACFYLRTAPTPFGHPVSPNAKGVLEWGRRA